MHSVGNRPSGAGDVRIVLMTDERIPETKALVDRVFPSQDPAERLFFWAYARRGTWLGKAVFWISRIAEVDRIWVSVDEADAVIGTTGLYRYRRDAHEAVWLSWFCVAPEARGRGVGSRLLDFSVEQARETGARYLRLYTSDDPNEADAQRLYESRGLRECRSKNRIFYRLIKRELELR